MIVLFVNVFTTIYKLAKSLSSRILAPPKPRAIFNGWCFFVIYFKSFEKSWGDFFHAFENRGMEKPEFRSNIFKNFGNVIWLFKYIFYNDFLIILLWLHSHWFVCKKWSFRFRFDLCCLLKKIQINKISNWWHDHGPIRAYS